MNALVQYESSSSDEEEGRPPSAARQAKSAKRASSKSGGKKAKVAAAEVTQSASVQSQNPAGYSNDWQAMGYAQQGYGQTWPQGYDYSQYAQAYGQWGDYQQWANYYAGYGQQQQYGTQASMQPPPVPPPTSSVGQSTTDVTASSTTDVTPQPPPPSGPPSEKPPLPTGAPPVQLTSPSTTSQQPEAKTSVSQSQTTSATSSSVDSQVSAAGQGQAGSQDTSSGQANMDPNMMWNNMWNYQQYDPQAWSQYYAGQGYQDPNMGQWGQWGQQWQNWQQQQQQQQGTAEQTGQQKQQQTQQQGGYQTPSPAATSETGQKPPPQGPPPQGPPPHGPPPGLNGQDQWQRPDWQQSWHPGQMGQRPPGPMDQGPRMRMRHMGPMDHGQRPRHRGPMDGPRHRHPPPMGQGPRMRHSGPMEHGPRGPRGPMEPGQRPRHHGPMDQRPRHPGGMDQRPRHRHPGPMDFGQRPRHPGGMDQRPRHAPPMDKGQPPRFPGSADQGPRPMEQGQRPRNPGAVDQGPRSRFPGPMDPSQRPRHSGPQGPRGRAPIIGEGKDSRWGGQPWQRDNRGPKDQDDQEEDQESEQPQKKEEPATEEKPKPALSLAERLKMIAESKAPQTASSSHLASRPAPSEKDKKKGSDEKGNANYVPLGFNKLQQLSRGNQDSDDGREARGPRGERGGRGDRGGRGGRGGRDDRGGRRSRFGQDDESRGSSWGRDRNQPPYRSGRDGRPEREGRDRDSRSDRDGRPSRFSHDRDRQGDSQQERRGSRFSSGPPSHGEQGKPGGDGNVRSDLDGKKSRWETPCSTGTTDSQNQPKSRTKWGSETTDGQEGPSKTLLPDPAGPPGGGGGSHQGHPPSLFDIQVQPSSHLRQGQGQGGQQQWEQRGEQESIPSGPRGSPSAGPRGPSPVGPRGPSPTGPRGPTSTGPRGSPSPGPRGPPPPQFQGHNQGGGNWSQQNFASPEGQGSGMKRMSANESQFSPPDGGPGIRPYTPKRARLEPDGSPSNPSPTGMVLQDTTMSAVQDIFEPYPKIVFALGKAVQSRIPEKRLADLQGHTGPVNTVEWCKADCSHLLLSSSMDRTVRVWDAIGDAKCVRTLTNHRAGVKMAAWTTDKKVLSCSFDKTAQLTDPQTGQTVSTFPHSNFVTVVRVHPQEHNLFLTGSTDIIQAWDSRTGKAVRDFKCKFGSVLDLAFFPSGKSFISSADVVARDSADKTIMVWDFNSAAKLSNQIFHERYSCPSLAVHPSEPNFIAQTNGDYIALFSTSRPYAMDKTVRFEGHKVQGYRIGCEFTPDGQMIVTGSGDGKVHYFNFYSGETTRQLNVYQNPCTDVKPHPVLSSTLATCCWSGQVSIWQ